MAAKYSDISLSFLPHPITKDISIVTDENSINQSIRNLVLTDTYDVPFSKIGGNIRAKLFELSSSMLNIEIESDIKNVIENYEPRAEVLSITATTEKNGVDVAIVYRARTTTQDITLNFFLERIV